MVQSGGRVRVRPNMDLEGMAVPDRVGGVVGAAVATGGDAALPWVAKTNTIRMAIRGYMGMGGPLLMGSSLIRVAF